MVIQKLVSGQLYGFFREHMQDGNQHVMRSDNKVLQLLTSSPAPYKFQANEIDGCKIPANSQARVAVIVKKITNQQ